MNYLSEINAFNDWCEQRYLSVQAQYLWYKLMAKNNRLGWCEWVQVDNLELMGILRTKRESTAIGIRDELLEAGLVERTKGKKGRPNAYKMISLSNLKVNSAVNTAVNSAVNTEANTADYNKPNETKQDISPVENPQGEFFDDGRESGGKSAGDVGREFSGDDVFEKIYEQYPRKEGKAKGKEYFMGYVGAGHEMKGFGKLRYDHLRIYFAVKAYAEGVMGKEQQFIKHFDGFMNKTILEYAEGTKAQYEAYMAEEYGAEWRKIKFKYRFNVQRM